MSAAALSTRLANATGLSNEVLAMHATMQAVVDEAQPLGSGSSEMRRVGIHSTSGDLAMAKCDDYNQYAHRDHGYRHGSGQRAGMRSY
jgi:hypothetical protein